MAESVTLMIVIIGEKYKNFFKNFESFSLKRRIPSVAPNDKPKLASYNNESGSKMRKTIAIANIRFTEFILQPLLIPR